MNPLEEIPTAIEEFAEAPPAATAELQPAKWTLKQLLTGHTQSESPARPQRLGDRAAAAQPRDVNKPR